MRILNVFGVVCIALALAGCDADQPLDSSSVAGNGGNTVVQVQATASVPLFNVWNWTEDTNGSGTLDVEVDVAQGLCDFRAPNCSGIKPAGDGRIDNGEDTNHNGVLDPGEDRSADGRLTLNEDFNNNGILDFGEDLNANCVRDANEPDTNGDAVLNTEDCDCDGWLDQVVEDRNQNGRLDFEDLNRNSQIDSGIWCEDPNLPPINGFVPVPLGGTVLLYRQGNPTPEVLADMPHEGGGLTPYDSRVFGTLSSKTVTLDGGRCAGGTNAGTLCTSDANCLGGGTCSFFQLNVTQGQQLPAGASRILNAPVALSPGAGNAGVCAADLGLGEPGLGAPLPIAVQTSPGDTITVRLQSKPPFTFNMIPQASAYAVGAVVTKNGTPLSSQGQAFADLGQPVSFHVAVP
ncbi:MAG TPA: hypothetical protein VFV75_15015 [Candidatus Polarisedimenticolaceae bacterium]|nr:hypothetical protein [Candidatus Polarisedimenticolaceae bacterium]